MDNVQTNKTANIKDKYSYQYVDIAQIHKYLGEKGWSYYQYIERIDGDDYVMTVRIIDGEEKPPLRGARVVDATLVGVDNPAQEQGSALTYARRYSLLMAFGLATEDNDAQGLSKPKGERKATEKQIAYIKRLYGENGLYEEDLENMTAERASELISARR